MRILVLSPDYTQGGSLPVTFSQGRWENLAAVWPVAMVMSLKPLL